VSPATLVQLRQAAELLNTQASLLVDMAVFESWGYRVERRSYEAVLTDIEHALSLVSIALIVHLPKPPEVRS
jgi:hypothetical protein